MSEKLSEYREMLSEAALMLRQVAEPKGNTKATIAFVARKFGWKQSRAKAIWYREARRVDVWEMDALRAEYASLRNTADALMAVLVEADPHRSREDISEELARVARLAREDPPWDL